MKIENWLLVGAGVVALAWIFGQKKDGESIGSSFGSAVGGGTADVATGFVSGTSSGIADWFTTQIAQSTEKDKEFFGGIGSWINENIFSPVGQIQSSLANWTSSVSPWW